MREMKLEYLERRRARLKVAMLALVAIAALALLTRGNLISPYLGIEGVHVPYDVPAHRLANQNLTYIWTGFGWMHLALGPLCQILGAGASLAFIWALIKRHSRIALYAFGSTLLINMFTPAPIITQPSPPRAMSFKDATAFVRDARNFHPRDPVSRRYMQAQVAYLEGNTKEAKRLSAGLTDRNLSSPSQGPYRLQFLQDKPKTLSSVCLMRGCLPQHALEIARTITVLVFLLSLLMAVVAWWLWCILDNRISRINEIRLQSRLRTRRA